MIGVDNWYKLLDLSKHDTTIKYAISRYYNGNISLLDTLTNLIFVLAADKRSLENKIVEVVQNKEV